MGFMAKTGRQVAEEVRSTSAKRSNSCPLPGEVPVMVTAPASPVTPAARRPGRVASKPVGPIFPAEPLSRASEMAREKMRQLTGTVPSTWVRLVHSGYGSQTWVQDLRDSHHVHIVTERPQEGIYVRVPTGEPVNDLVDKLMAMNLVVRKKTQFKDMKRSNKSRLQFKATVTVFPCDQQQEEHDSNLPQPEEQEHSSSGDELKSKPTRELLPAKGAPQPPVPQPPAQQPGYFVYYMPPQPTSPSMRAPEYWNRPTNYDWDENGQAVSRFRTPSPVPMQVPEVSMQPPQVQGGYYPQAGQPVYVCVGMMKNPLYAPTFVPGRQVHGQ